MTMPAWPLATSSRTCFFWAAVIEPVSSATRVAPVQPAQLAAHGQRAEHVVDRSQMLRGKDFRRRQQRALVAGVDHLQHRQHRDDRLAGTDLALQQPVQRAGRREPGGQHVEHLPLPRGQLERQLLQQLCGQTVRPSAAPAAPTPTARRAGARPAPTAGRRLRRRSAVRALAAVRARFPRDGWRAALRPRRSGRARRAVRRAMGPRPDRARRAPGARRRRCPSSAFSCWPDRSGRSGLRMPTSIFAADGIRGLGDLAQRPGAVLLFPVR